METRIVTLSALHPIARPDFEALTSAMRQLYHNDKVEHLFCPFETYRTPLRQDELYAQGRENKDVRVTKTRAWASAHQYGLAVDFAAWDLRKRSYYWPDNSWSILEDAAHTCGLVVPIKWDRGHVEHPLWAKLREAIA